MTIVDTKDKRKEEKSVLVNQEDALTVYLQSLLGTFENVEAIPAQDSDMISSVQETLSVQNAMSVQKATPDQEQSPVSALIAPPIFPVAHEQDSVKSRHSISSSVFIEEAITVDKKVIPFIPIVKNHLPEWASDEIRCLSANVGGLKVLIPAEFIESIQKVNEKLKPSLKMPVWIYELEVDDDEPVQVVNTRKLIFDGIKSRRIDPNSRSYVVLLDDGAWGLNCDSIGAVVNVKSKEVTWRGEGGKRRWLAGTSSANEAVILDVKKIEKALIS